MLVQPCLSLSLLPIVAARLVNVTVDDSGSDPFTGATIVYDGPAWLQGNTCAGCWAQPDPSQAHGGTWKDATYDFITPNRSAVVQTATFPFTGNAVYVYGLLSQSLTVPNSTADISFSIDGQLIHTFSYTPPGIAQSFLYNFLLWHSDTLPNAEHTLSLQNGIPDKRVSLMLLDYIVYTRDDGTPDPPAPGPTPPPPPSVTATSPASEITSTITVPLSSLMTPWPLASLSNSMDSSASTGTGGLSSASKSTPSGISPSSMNSVGVYSSSTSSTTAGPSPNVNADDHKRGGGSRVIIMIAVAASVSFLALVAVAYLLYKLSRRRRVQLRNSSYVPGEIMGAVTPFVSDGHVGRVRSPWETRKGDDSPPAYSSLENSRSRRL